MKKIFACGKLQKLHEKFSTSHNMLTIFFKKMFFFMCTLLDMQYLFATRPENKNRMRYNFVRSISRIIKDCSIGPSSPILSIRNAHKKMMKCDRAQRKEVKCSNKVSEMSRFWNISCFERHISKTFHFLKRHIFETFYALNVTFLKHFIFWNVSFLKHFMLWTLNFWNISYFACFISETFSYFEPYCV